MELSSPVYDGGLIEEITRITEAPVTVYSNKARIARLNQALDKYWALASDSAPRGTFDDVNNTGIPVETQSLVAGTNAYKIGSFTNEVLQILKLSILDEDAKEADICREEFRDVYDFNELYSTDTADRGTPQYWAKMGDYIYLRPCPDYAEADGLRAYVNRELSKFAWVTCTATVATDKINATAHGLSDNDAVIFETDGTIIGGITADTTVYYVVNKADDTFEVSTVIGGTKVTITDAQATSNHKFTEVSKIPGIPVIHHDYLARQASLPFLIEKKLPQLSSIAQLILKDEHNVSLYWQNRGKELKTIIRPRNRNYK